MLPRMQDIPADRQMVDVFRGYNHNLRIGDGEFFNEENMTHDYYPVLAPRKPRQEFALPESPKHKVNGIQWTDAGMVYIDSTDVVCKDFRVNMGLTDGTKNLIEFGAYLIIMPDRKYINLRKPDDRGGIDARFHADRGIVNATLCNESGLNYGDRTVGNTAPSSPKGGQLWVDTSSSVNGVLKRYNPVKKSWDTILKTYIKFAAEGIGNGFRKNDVVNTSLWIGNRPFASPARIIDVAKNNSYLVFSGMIPYDDTIQRPCFIARCMPTGIEYIIECNNRLWGCRHAEITDEELGEDGFYNEIRCCEVGNFRNWQTFEGTSLDSYAVAVGSEGDFTGAVSYNNHPIFFKENCLHKVYGNIPANFQVQTTEGKGVAPGSHKSLAIVNGILMYHSHFGFVSYDGSLPRTMDNAFGDDRYEGVVSCAFGNKYLTSVKRVGSQQSDLFVFDTTRGFWVREDSLRLQMFANSPSQAIGLTDKGKVIQLSGNSTSAEKVHWSAETGEIGINSPDQKYVSKLTLRMSMDVGSRLRVYAMYDFEDDWVLQFELHGDNLRSFSVPIRPCRCDYVRLRFEGLGDAKLYSIAKTVEYGGENT